MKKDWNIREVMKSHYEDFAKNRIKTGQSMGMEAPPLQKPYDKERKKITLPEPREETLHETHLFRLIKKRRSRRRFKDKTLTIEEFSFLLWATQGVQKTFENNPVTFRSVPSAGAKHPFETYLAVRQVEGLEPGIYRYLALENALVFLREEPEMEDKITDLTFGQRFAAEAAVVFFWSCIPARTEWKYGKEAVKYMFIDAGHIAQNLYLASEAAGCGTCAIGAYSQQKADRFLELDGEEEFVVYLAPVGKK